MTTISMLINQLNRLSRSSAIVDALAALSIFVSSFLVWLYVVSKVSVIDYDANDLLVLGSYGLIFFVATVLAPYFFMSGARRPMHYAQAVYAPLKWEINLRKHKWFLGEYELRKIINADDESRIRHNLSLIYRNLLFSLPAYGLHSVSTVFYFGEHPVQISILTEMIILALLFDVARRAKRIYVILHSRARIEEGPRSGPLGEVDRRSSSEGYTMARQKENLVLTEQPSTFSGNEFDALLDNETKDVLTKIKGRSQQQIVEGLVRTGVYTEDGKLTKKYGGSQ
jgi:hypothetical protein